MTTYSDEMIQFAGRNLNQPKEGSGELEGEGGSRKSYACESFSLVWHLGRLTLWLP
jgi:hypothetical protein